MEIGEAPAGGGVNPFWSPEAAQAQPVSAGSRRPQKTEDENKVKKKILKLFDYG